MLKTFASALVLVSGVALAAQDVPAAPPGDVDRGTGMPAAPATPAVPAAPAGPGGPDGVTVPAVPAVPATPPVQVIPGNGVTTVIDNRLPPAPPPQAVYPPCSRTLRDQCTQLHDPGNGTMRRNRRTR